jgi:uncharacterized DUF497 family protein
MTKNLKKSGIVAIIAQITNSVFDKEYETHTHNRNYVVGSTLTVIIIIICYHENGNLFIKLKRLNFYYDLN